VSYQDSVTNLWRTSRSEAPILEHAWTGHPTYAAFSADGATLAISAALSPDLTRDPTYHPQVELWNLTEPLHQPARTIPNSWGQVAFAADAHRIAVRTMDAYHNDIWVYPTDAAPTGRSPITEPLAFSRPLGLSPDGRTAVEVLFNAARVQDVRPDGGVEPIAELSNGDTLFPPMFTRDGTRVVVPDGTNGVAVWDMRDPRHPQEYAELSGWQGQVLAAAIAPDGRLTILTTGGQLAVTLDVGPAIAGICGQLKDIPDLQRQLSSHFPDMDVPMPCQQ
jgi:hypothetical protein